MLTNMQSKPIRFDGRLYFVLVETDGANVCPKGIVVAPPNMGEKEARHCIERMTRWAIGWRFGKRWRWADVVAALQRKGFEYIKAGYVVERRS